VTIGPFEIQYMQLFVITTTVCLMVALTIFVARTQVGRAMRATSFDLEAASMMGYQRRPSHRRAPSSSARCSPAPPA
jgi:branched-subunit amino acid ABC-type transport system permease component